MITISQLVAAIRSGRLRASDYLDECLARLDELEPAVQAWVLLDAKGARRAAAAIDAEDRAADPRPLLGVPIGIKDLIDVAGMPTLAGSPLRAGHIAKRDATIVARLRAAGAIILGKTVTTEWACFDPPPTRNPWSLSHTPGGSSSGSAAAVATRMCPAAIGSQTGGSIIRPASYCGVAGLKATFGRVSRAGILPASEHLDHVGPIAATAADLAILLSVIAGPDDSDPYALDDPVDDYSKQLDRATPPRLGVPDIFFMDQASPDIAAVTTAALDTLRAAGAEIVPIALPESFAEVIAMHWRVMAAEISDVHGKAFAEKPEAFGHAVAALIQEGLAMSQDEYRQALDHRELFREEIALVFGDVDALVTPSTDTTAPDDLGITGSPRLQAPWSYAGLPAATIPCGIAEDGLPAGLQFVGRDLDEVRLLGAAAWCERALGANLTPLLK